MSRRPVLAAGGGFLLAVLWMDLMFDVQVLRYGFAAAAVPEPVIDSIAAYYRRVTTDAHPMGHAIGVVMLVTLVTSLFEARAATGPWSRRIGAPILCGAPIALAALRVFPNAVRLGSQIDPLSVQTELAQAICRDHLLCLAAIVGFLWIQLTSGSAASGPAAA